MTSRLNLSLEDKWKLVPSFLRVRGLVKQHIDSFDYFIREDLKKIVRSNEKIVSDVDPTIWLQYTDIRVGKPVSDQDLVTTETTPQQCRLRDITYSAPIVVDVTYTKREGNKIVQHSQKDVLIGRMPIMLRSFSCVLNNRSDGELESMGECALDPGGYFIVKGVEKVILVQEQLSKNRMIVEMDNKEQIVVSVTSSTHERKSKTNVVMRAGKFYLRHNSFVEDLPIIVVLKVKSNLIIQSSIMFTSGTHEFDEPFV